MTQLILKRAPIDWNQDDYDVLEDSVIVGRMFLSGCGRAAGSPMDVGERATSAARHSDFSPRATLRHANSSLDRIARTTSNDAQIAERSLAPLASGRRPQPSPHWPRFIVLLGRRSSRRLRGMLRLPAPLTPFDKRLEEPRTPPAWAPSPGGAIFFSLTIQLSVSAKP
jgi:hypothetical protein